MFSVQGAGQQVQPTAQLPPPPVQPAQIPPVLQGSPSFSVDQGATPVVVQPTQLAPAGPSIVNVRVAPHMGITPQAAPGSMPTVPPSLQNLDPPHYAMMQNALFQAMQQQNTANSTITMEDITNFLMSQGRSSVHYGGQNPSEHFQRPKPQR